MTRSRTDTAPEVDEPAPVIREPWITEPGAYPDLTDAEYHADPVVGGSLSSSGARLLLPPNCPALFHHVQQNGRPPSQAFDLGLAAHAVVLGTGLRIKSLPFRDRRSNAYKAAEAKARANGEVPLLEAEVETVYDMAAALLAHPIAGPLLSRPGRVEQSYVARDPETGVMCRVRFDFLPDPEDGGPLDAVDYKTTADAYPDAFGTSLGRYGYHVQAAFYLAVLRWLGLLPDAGARFVFIAQEKTAPYLVTVGTPSERAMQWGEVLARKARDLYLQCTRADHWPGYSDHTPAEFDIPGWLDHAYDAAATAGAFDTIGDLTR